MDQLGCAHSLVVFHAETIGTLLDPAVHGMGAPQGVIVSDLIRAE